MSITSLDQFIAASKVIRSGVKTATRTTVSNAWFSLFDVAGEISGVLGGGETTPPANSTGRVPTDSIPGYPTIPWSGNLSYLSRLAARNTVASTIRLFDRVWVGGTYAFNANVAVTSPSWASRVSFNAGAADYAGCEIWVENVTTATGNLAVSVTYTDAVGGVGRSTGAVGIGAAPTVGRCWQLPLQAGDNAPSAISNVAGSVASAGTFNVMVLRPIVDIYLPADVPISYNWSDLGLPEIFNDSALYWLLYTSAGTSSGTVGTMTLQLANG